MSKKEPDLLVVVVVTVLIRGSNRCGEFVQIPVEILHENNPTHQIT